MQINAVKSLFRGCQCFCALRVGLLLINRHIVWSFEKRFCSAEASERYYMDEDDQAGDVQTRRLAAVVGEDGKTNDIIFAGRFSPAQSNVVFFGGDIQDYVEAMRSHRDNFRYEQWNLETTARHISRRFATSHVWVVKPAMMELKTFSMYKNFLAWEDFSKPVFKAGQRSWSHLSLLLKKAVERMNADHEKEAACYKETCQTFQGSLPLLIIGFSKGCVVLNQLIYDLDSADDLDFISNVKVLYWLDGGHNGGSNVWITDEKILKHLVQSAIEVESHVTPYQIKDLSRPWIGREHKQFLAKMAKLGGRVKNVIHFGNEERSIENHFKLLTEF